MDKERDLIPLNDDNHDDDHDSDDDSGHVDEKWLVSYADLMTLLFGLFVMLYTMAMETQGKPEKYFSDLASASVAKNDTHPDMKNEPKPAAESDLKNSQITELKEQLQKAQVDLAEATAKLQQASTPSDILTKSLEESKLEISQFKERQNNLLTEIESLKQVSANLEKNQTDGSSAEKVKLRKQIEAMKTKLSKVSNQQDLLIAEKAQLEKEITKLKAPSRAVAADPGTEEYKQKMMAQKVEIENLQKKISDLSKQNMNSFLGVMISWETEKHDLDLVVTDPAGRAYSFTKRSYKESPAKFVLDSRTGPGIEMWQTPVLIPGEYRIDFVFYNNYENTNPALVSGSIVTSRGEFAIPAFKLDFTKKKKSFKLKVTPEGQVTIQ